MNMSTRDLIADDSACPVDQIILGSSLLLLVLGWVMVASASSEIAARNYGNPFWYATRHFIYIFSGFIAGTTALMLPIRVWQRSSWILLLLSLFSVSYCPGSWLGQGSEWGCSVDSAWDFQFTGFGIR